MNKKEEIRKNISIRKKEQSEENRKEASEKIFSMLENCIIFKNSRNILLYHSLPDEVETHTFINKWCDKKQFFLPRVNGTLLEILAYDKEKLRKGSFGIKEPAGNKPEEITDLDLIIVPAVALDKKGNRIGRGKGYYDKLLHNCDAYKTGIIYSYQLIETIPYDIHDIPMDMVITEEGIITPNM